VTPYEETSLDWSIQDSVSQISLANNNMLSVVIPAGTLANGTEYVLSLRASRSTGSLRTDHRFRTKNLPNVGTTTVMKPSPMRAVESKVGLILSGFSSDDDPLIYQIKAGNREITEEMQSNSI
jgi:hypothetical protein